MSKHSNIQSQNHQAAQSQNNHPQSLFIAQSTRPPQLPHDAGNKEWIATFIDGRYFLTDPQSINKLKNIEAEIEQQRRKLAQLQQENIDNNHSFLSQPLVNDDRHSNHSFCDTEFNEGKQNTKEEKVKNQLEKEQEMYRERIKIMQRAKQDMKKQMKLAEKSQKVKEESKSQISPSKKPSQKSKIQETPRVLEVQHDPKSIKKSIRQDSKSKSYHKSRIQKSIKDNQMINQDVTENIQKQSNSHIEHLAVQQNPISIAKSQKGNKSVAKSSKIEEKSLRIQQNNVQAHQNLIKEHKQVSIREGKSMREQKQVSVREAKSIKGEPQPSVKEQNSVKIQKSIREEKSVRIQQPQSEKKQNSIKSSKLQAKSININKQLSAKEQTSAKQFKQASVKIQKSMKNEKLAVEQILVGDARSQKLSSMKKDQPSVRISNKNDLQIQEPQHSQNKSVKISQKNSKVNDNFDKKSAKQYSKEDKKASEKAFEMAMDKIQRVSQRPLSIKSSYKNKEILSLDPSPTLQKSVKNPSVKPSSKHSNQQQQNEQKSSKGSQSYKIQIHPDPHQHSHSQISKNSDSPSKKSAKSSNIIEKEKSLHSTPKVDQQEINSKKSSKIDQANSKRSSKLDQINSKKSSKLDQVKSKKSSKLDENQVVNANDKLQDANESKSIIISDKKSFAKKSSIHQQRALQVQQPQPESPPKMDLSIQWSRSSEKNNENPSPPFEPPSSQKNSSYFINNNDQSLNESSHLKLQMLNNQLKPQVQAASPQPNMKKKKQQPIENQSEKKSKSFVIHSRHGSVKDRSDKNYDKLNNSKISSPSKKSRGPQSSFRQSDAGDVQSVTKQEIIKLHEQIALLQEKLKKVEERQDNLQKFEGTFSKVEQPEISQIEQRIQVQTPIQRRQISPIRETPIVNSPQVEQLSIGLKIQPRLQIQSSILQVNTMQQMKKKHEKQTQVSEKAKLKEQISRLKKIIRDMQIEKIKSIDHEASLDDSVIKPIASKHFDGKESRQIVRESRNIEKQSIHSHDGPTQRRFFGSNNKRLLEDAGKIMHNNASIVAEKLLQTPRRKSIHKIKGLNNEQDVVTDNLELPNQSNNKKLKNKYYSEARKNELVSRLGDKERQFHNFIESSRVIAEEGSNSKPELQQIASPLNNFSRFSVPQESNGSSKINYSRMVEEMKKNNPQEQQILPEIHIRDIKMPILPQQPHADMSQQQLLSLAKATYLVFGINIDEEDKQLCVKKYKNCVIFTINNQHHQCILWHYSGKFYMGGWKTGQPGEGEKNGDGLQYIPDKYVYKGQFLNGKKNGSGIIKLLNGNIYDGQWTQGVKNGRGVYLDASTKVVYSGQWREGKKEGQGYLKLSEKQYYYGTFVKSVKEGFGVEVFVNGDKYKGQYKNGKFNGKGKYTWANGSCYEGQFVQGVRYGQGSWKSAKFNGDIYIGSYQNDKKNGYGRYVWANGCMYQGGFANDVKHGKGRLTYQDGKEIRGVWEEGNLVTTLDSQKKGVEHEQQPLRRSVKVTTFGYPHSMKRI